MNAALVNIIALQFIAAMLAAIMAIAWRTFEKPRHAFTWAMAFGVATIAWLFSLIMRIGHDENPVLYAVVAGLGCTSNALIAMGFVQRSRPSADGKPFLIATAAAAVLIAVLSFVTPHRGFLDGTWLSFSGTMLAISAAQVARTGRPATLPERATTLMLMLFATVDFGMAALAFGVGPAGGGAGLELLRLVLILMYPPAFIGVGLFTVFLVAADLAERMRTLAVSDLLTGIPNRRGFEEAAEKAIRNAQRQGQPLTLVVSDIDRFKAINDRYGHAAGDRAIRHFAGRLEKIVRRGDLIGRIGGEEFALVLVNTRSTDAIDVVERIRCDVSGIPVEGPESIVMSASFGLTGMQPEDGVLANLFARADRALYRSKVDGRNRVTCAEKMDIMSAQHGKAWVTSDPV